MSKILVTGGASGLGWSICMKLIADGGIVKIYDKVNNHQITNPDIEWIGNELDILINCAGVPLVKNVQDMTLEEWDTLMDVNAGGVFQMSKACLPLLKKSKGTILNIISDASHRPMTGSTAYCASKAAVHSFTQTLARELRHDGVCVFGISPCRLLGTKMSSAVDAMVMKERGWPKELVQQNQAAGLLVGEVPPENIADFIAFLLSTKERHRYLSGCVIPYGT